MNSDPVEGVDPADQFRTLQVVQTTGLLALAVNGYRIFHVAKLLDLAFQRFADAVGMRAGALRGAGELVRLLAHGEGQAELGRPPGGHASPAASRVAGLSPRPTLPAGAFRPEILLDLDAEQAAPGGLLGVEA